MAKKGLPKKYAKMGFKKGWKAYKASQKKTSRKTTTKTRRRSSSMARRRKYTRRAKRMNMKFWGSAVLGFLGVAPQLNPYMPIVGGIGYAIGKGIFKDVGFGWTVGQSIKNLVGGNIALPFGGGATGNGGML